METIRWRFVFLTMVAPAAWGTTYIVTEQLLPPDRPLFAATVRALPVGLVLLAMRRRLPTGIWWWRAIALGVCNIGLFFPLIFLAAYHLPGGLAATVQAASPLAVMALALPIIRERPGRVRIGAALVGLVGVGLLVLRSPGQMDTLGLVGAFGSVVVSALGFVLIKKWPAPVDMLTLISWQLVVGGLVLLPVGLLVEGPPPADRPARRRRVRLARGGRHGRRLLLLVPRSHPDAGRRRLPHRPGQPGRRHRPRGGPGRRAVRLGAGPRHGARPRRRGRRPARRGRPAAADPEDPRCRRCGRIRRVRTPGRSSFRLRDIALAAYAPSAVSSVGFGAVIPVLALRARDLGAGVDLAALIVALLGIGQLMTSLPAGALVARIGERRMLVGCGVVDVVAMGYAAFADTVLGLGVAVVVSGATWTGFLLARQGYMIEAVPADPPGPGALRPRRHPPRRADDRAR